MTSEAAKARDEHLIAAIVVVLIAGHTVESPALRLWRNEQGQFVVKVLGQDLGLITERDDVFDEAHDAAAFYLDLCDPPPSG